MTLEDIWNQLCRKQPRLLKENATVEFKSQNLKALLSQVYEQAQKAAVKVEESKPKSSPFSGLGW